MMLFKLLSGTNLHRFDPVVISLLDNGPMQAKIESLGIPVYSVGMLRGLPTPAAAWRLVKLVRRLCPDLVQSWMYHGNLAALLATSLLPDKIPLIWNIRGSHYKLREEKLITALTIWSGAKLSGLPARIINNSRHSAEGHHRHLGYRADKTVIIPNGFDANLFAPSENARNEIRSELGLPPDSMLIGLIGRYHPVKDHHGFLKAAALLLNSSDINFVLAGNGVDDKNLVLKRQICDLGLSDRVYLLGERNDVARLTSALDIATSSSYSEGFPNVVGEAMACGIPCVVTDVGDSAWIIGETGVVVPPRDPEALARAWTHLVSLEPEKRRNLGLAARERVIRHFSLSSVITQYETLYDEVLSNHHAGKDCN